MYPHHYHSFRPYAHGRFRGRLFWFVVGAFSATWWIKSREYYRRPEYIQLGRNQTQDRSPNPRESEEEPKWESRGSLFDARDRERMRELSSQASDIISDVSETVLETVFTTLESFRAKLAEQRARREKMLSEKQETEPRRLI